MKLYGTTTSPFVRRVRVVAAELGVPLDLVNTATDDGQAALRAVSPIRKVPVAVLGGRTLFDSRVIIDYLTTVNGWGGVAPARDRWREQNLVNAIDGALDAAIQVFYLRRDGVPVEGSAYATRQRDRIAAIFAWLATELATPTTFDAGLGLAEISLIATLDWMDFRETYPTGDAFAALRAAWRERPSLAATRPHA
ncbi:MAG: glutathione S-transferase family protein [Deltaproteobacteria bacterium]|nr:glutathione S-transferase family protein [Deltaproteobacteria bacterium]